MVRWGLRHCALNGNSALGVDEVSVGKGQFWTLVYQIDEGARRLLWIGKDRNGHSLKMILHRLTIPRCQQVRFICALVGHFPFAGEAT